MYLEVNILKEKKIRIPLWIYPSTEEKILKNYEADNCKLTLSRLRGLCVEEVKRLRGAVRLEDAVRFQNGDD